MGNACIQLYEALMGYGLASLLMAFGMFVIVIAGWVYLIWGPKR